MASAFAEQLHDLPDLFDGLAERSRRELFHPHSISRSKCNASFKTGYHCPDYPPFDFVVQGKSYEGIGADYALLVQDKLGIPVFAVQFNNRDEAIRALQTGSIDLLANSNTFEASHTGIVLSTPYLDDLPAISTRIDFDWTRQKDYTDLTVVAAYDYLPLNVLQSRFPGALIKQMDSPAKAMAALIYGQADLMFSELQVAGYLIDHNYPNAAKIVATDPAREKGLGFALNADNTHLQTRINKAIQQIAPAEHALIARRWSVAGLGATSSVRTVTQNQTVRVVVDRSSPPLSYFDEQGTYRGITADLLARISLSTGLRFEFEPVNGLEDALRTVRNGQADMLVDFNPDDDREQYLQFSRPYLSKPFVWIGTTSSGAAPPKPDQSVSIALPRAHTLIAYLQGKYPQARLIETNNNADSLERVKQGQAQYTVMNLSTASYYLSRSEDSRLKMLGELDEPLAKASFGVSQNNLELLGLLDNALRQVQPDEINALANRWRNNAVVQLSDWRDYKSILLQGALLVIAALVLFAAWNFVLRRQIRLRKMAEQELTDQLNQRQQLLNELASAKRQAEKANAAKSVFLATISHEIKTPLSAVMGTLELELEKTAENSDRVEPLKTALRSASELSRLIGDILDTVQIETGHLSVHPAPTNLRKLCEELIQNFSATAEQKNLALQLQWTGPEHTEAILDDLRLRQILGNLISNAVKYTLTGQITLHVKVSQKAPDNAAFLFTVTDTGPGISAEHLENLFKPFEKVHSSTAGGTEGTGLGLYICKELAKLMGGELSIQSQLGEGTRANFKLTCPIAGSVRPEHSEFITGELVTKTIQPLRILVVDDHAPNRILLAQQLNYLGHQTVPARNGAEALVLWKAHAFDCVLTDCSMPVMDGFELAKAIRRQEQSEGQTACLILGTTAHEGPDIRQQCMNCGMNDCLAKPLGLQTLKAKLFQYMVNDKPAEPLFKLSTLRTLSGNNTENMQTLLQTLLDANLEDLLKLKKNLMDNTHQEQAETIHRIKGAAKMIGAYRLLTTIETYEGASNMEQRTALAREVSDALERLIEAMQQQTHNPPS